MSYDELIALLQAAKAGKAIQRPIGDGKWGDCPDFILQIEKLKFRIKPEPRTIWLREKDIPRGFTFARVAGTEKDATAPGEHCNVVKFIEVIE